jgi:hypothetical protein
MLVMPATREAEVGGSRSEDGAGQKHKTLSAKHTNAKGLEA